MNDSDKTISDSKEESIQKALELMGAYNKPEREITRPNISLFKTLLFFVLWLAGYFFLSASIFYLGNIFGVPSIVLKAAAVILLILLVVFKAKSFIVNSVLLYQKFAPYKIRKACLFTPSCSEYMLLAVEKYGPFVGFVKGIGRILRCHHPNGGEDYP